MKKIIVIGVIVLVIIVGAVIVIGNNKKKSTGGQTQKSTSSSTSDVTSKTTNLDKEGLVNKLHFKYSSDASIKDTTNGKQITYENYNIIVSHQKDRTIEEIEKSRNYSSVNEYVNNKIAWKKYGYTSEQVSAEVYMYERDNGTYVVTINHDVNLNISLDKETEEFMNNISFE